ncbi:MAG: c-type cytochrome domain-containing protein, partial [Myxococcota bacterium]
MTRAATLVLLALAACNTGSSTDKSGTDTPTDTNPGTNPGTTPDPTGNSGWCDVQVLFARECTLCHSPALTQGELDLQTAPYDAIVNVASTFGPVLVAPGDPEGSLLYRKITGTQAADEGVIMPESGLLGAADQELVRAWIADGASDLCDATTPPTTPPGQY